MKGCEIQPEGVAMSLYDKEREEEAQIFTTNSTFVIPTFGPYTTIKTLPGYRMITNPDGSVLFDYAIPSKPKCECGSEASGFTTHSHWCPKHGNYSP